MDKLTEMTTRLQEHKFKTIGDKNTVMILLSLAQHIHIKINVSSCYVTTPTVRIYRVHILRVGVTYTT